MEQQRQKWVNLSFLALAALVGFLLFSIAFKLVGQFDLEAKVRNVDWIVRIGSIVAAAIVYAVLAKNKQANQFMDEVVLEVTRVTWPSEKDSARATVVVIIMVLIAGMILGGMDVFFAWLVKVLL